MFLRRLEKDAVLSVQVMSFACDIQDAGEFNLRNTEMMLFLHVYTKFCKIGKTIIKV